MKGSRRLEGRQRNFTMLNDPKDITEETWEENVMKAPK